MTITLRGIPTSSRFFTVNWINSNGKAEEVLPRCINEPEVKPIRGLMPVPIQYTPSNDGMLQPGRTLGDVLDALQHGAGIVMPNTDEVEFL